MTETLPLPTVPDLNPHPLTTPYSSPLFHTQTLSIRLAGLALRGRSALTFISTVLEPLIKSHNMTAHFGVGLVHRHFDMAEHEILVECNGTSTPWAVKPGTLGFNGGTESLVWPVAWMLVEEEPEEDRTEDEQGNEVKHAKWMPYEFAFSPVGGRDSYIVDVDSPAYIAFLTEFTAALQASGFQDILGLRAWPGPGFKGLLEFTQGKANITLKPGEYVLRDSEEVGYTQTMWFWEKEFEDANCRCICNTGRHGGHVGHGGHYGPRGDVHAEFD
jgi:hypothetical protein